MRLAIFSDVHGNLTALEAVLADIHEQNPDLVFFAGDLCVFGARPGACVQRLREENISSIYGNTDGWISNEPLLSDNIEEEERERSQNTDTPAEWAWAQMNEPDRAWLRTLPYFRRFSPTINPHDDLFLVHANPQDVNRPIHPPEERQLELYGEVKQPDQALGPLLKDTVAGVLAFGHVHIPSVREWEDLTLANVSSVSLPLDGDSRAKYALFDWDGGWAIEHRRIEYDVAGEVELLARLKPPKWRELSQQLQIGRRS